MEVSCVIQTINKAKARRRNVTPLIIHSDRGKQFVSEDYIKATENIRFSYSKKAFPWDTFHTLIKREGLKRLKIRNFCHAYQLVFEYIETVYNTVRIHSHCDYLSLDDYERLYQQRLETEIGLAS